MRTTLLTILALTAVTAACSEEAAEPTAVQTEALVASASEWAPAEFLEGLEVDAATRERIEGGVTELHGSMLALHERLVKAEALTGDARAAALQAVEPDLQALHARHLELWNSLSAEVRDELASRFHDRMEHGEDGPMKAFHERMRRLHGGGH